MTSMLLGLTFAACGGDDDDDDTGSNGDSSSNGSNGSSSGDGKWRGTVEGDLKIEAEFFVDASDESVADFETIRKAAEAPEVVYARVSATNEGEEPDTGRFLTLTDGEGDKFADDAIILDFACALASGWVQKPGIDAEALNTYTELYGGPCASTIAGPTIPPGETVIYFVAVEGSSAPEFERAFAASAELKK